MGQTIDFESAIPHITLDSVPGSVWQVGEPQKTVFNAARSPVNALMTDTLNTYPPNTVSSFTYEVLYPISSSLEFWYMIDSEPGMDGGYIEISVDTGQTWHLVTGNPLEFWNTPFPISVSTSLYNNSDTLYNGNLGISGSEGWSQRGIYFDCLAVKNPNFSVLLRFNFISNGSDERDGWMLDDFNTTNFPCSSNKNIKSNQLKVIPNPASHRIVIDFNDEFLEGNILISNVMGQTVMQQQGISGYGVAVGVDHLPEGMYFYQLETTDELTYTGKLLISRE